MAWNEPGGGRNQDPWGGGNNQGPPDLDEAFKKLQEKLNSIFGGGRSSGGGGSGGGFDLSAGLLATVAVVVTVVWALFGFYQIDAQEQGIVLRLGKYHETVGAGLHWNPPLIDDVTKVLVTSERQYSSRGLMLTQDENIVELPLTVQYNVSDAKAFVLDVRSPEISLQHATDSALRHEVGSNQLDTVLSIGREQLGDAVKIRLQKYLDLYGTGIQVVQINIQEAKPPSEVRAAYDDVIKAREDQERLINEAQSYANGIIPEARGKAQRQIEEASAYREQVVAEAQGEAARFTQLLTEYRKAPAVTRERLYLDTLQQVYTNTSKVMVDVEGGNNLLYLPLDKMMERAPAQRSTSDTGTELDMRQLTDRVVQQLRRDNQVRGREGR
ncbi:MAG: FtsH protease activity modulator HflK [Spongiibacteraceae bacterium]|jgi:membrane protease subunit HflK|nr:FtsH protease activity modulator HflK [Spongiibacteraceae bacterium]